MVSHLNMHQRLMLYFQMGLQVPGDDRVLHLTDQGDPILVHLQYQLNSHREQV